jgi:hypothetical protein
MPITDPIIFPLKIQKFCDGTYKGLEPKRRHVPHYGQSIAVEELDPQYSKKIGNFCVMREACPVCGRFCVNILTDHFKDDCTNDPCWFLS